MSHPLHLEVGILVQQFHQPPRCSVLLAPECGGSQNIPLFGSSQKGNHTEYCNIDALIVLNGKIRAIVEVEESSLRPTNICGKFLASALSTHFIHDVLNNTPSMMDDRVSFLQILDATQLPQGTSKLRQGSALESSIRSILPLTQMARYRLVYFMGAQEFQTDQTKRRDLRNWIQEGL